mgnify:CR=1 FL=1
MKKIAILGSTGSIGTQTLEVVRNNPELQVAALAAGKSVEQMEKQIREFHPLIAGMWSEEAAADLRSRVADLPVKVVSGMDGLLEIATMPQSQVLVTAIVGMIGIRPTIAAIEAGKDIALANKETLVTAGHIIMPLAAKMGVKILPVDSEHSAIFQSLNGEPAGRIEKILLTASGGPFRGRTREQLQNIQVEDALKHPNWSMGRKITIDSSTLVNKGLEVMEVKWLFGVDLDQIQVIVHPQSIIHSAVQYVDGAVIFGASFVMPGISGQMVPGNSSGYETAATILGGGTAPEYIIIGLLSFLLGVCVTILCFRVHLLDKEEQAEQRGDRTNGIDH